MTGLQVSLNARRRLEPRRASAEFLFESIADWFSTSQVSASQFFVFILFTYVSNLAMLAIFRSLASANRHEPNATLAAGILVLIIAIYVGYSIPRPSMKVWFRWLSYAQPVSFGFESLIANECKLRLAVEAGSHTDSFVSL